jgi:hypothetical protein
MAGYNLPLFQKKLLRKQSPYWERRPLLAICPICKAIYRQGKGLARGCSLECCRKIAFWRQVEKTETCWLWRGHLNPLGYGIFSHRSKRQSAYRVAYIWLVGAVPEGLTLDHLCRIPACVNPAHLEPVTQQENILRGQSIVARHAQKTHCNSGHAFTSENTSVDKRGWRRCLVCKRLRFHEARARQRIRENGYNDSSAIEQTRKDGIESRE